MKFLEILGLGLAIGLPSMTLQYYLYYHERKRKSQLWSTWAELQSELARVLHRPHPESQPLDRLLEKLETFTAAGISTISKDDGQKLTVMLRQLQDDTSQPKIDRQRAEFMLLAIPRAQRERAEKK
jgi:hypothetical protein